jgi:hypothetical protein
MKDSRDPSTANWTADGGGTTYALTAGPDGSTVAVRKQISAGQYSRYQGLGTLPGAAVFSLWGRNQTAGGKYQLVTSAGAVLSLAGTSVDTAWTRRVLARSTGGGANFIPADGRDWTANGGIAVTALDVHQDLIQVEDGLFATEAIVSGALAATRAGERLYLASPAALLSSGSLGLYARLEPKGASSQYGADMYLLGDASDATTYCKVDKTTRAVKIAVAGDVYTTAAAMTWSADDDVELFVRVGGVPAAFYRVGGVGAWTELSTGGPAAQASLTLAGALNVLCNNTSNQFTARVRELRAYRAGTSPVS